MITLPQFRLWPLAALAAQAFVTASIARPPGASPADPATLDHAAPWRPGWTQLAGGPRRIASIISQVHGLASPRWIVDKLPNGAAIDFANQSGIVADEQAVLSIGRVGGVWHLIACAASGTVSWSTPVPSPTFLSWASPVIDRARNSALLGIGSWVVCANLSTGAVRWQTPLPAGIVNASLVATNDMPGANRAFITDFDGLGADARLYSINLDPYTGSNPFSPGDVVWSTAIGAASGNSPAYCNRTVYVASNMGSYEPGSIWAFDADAQSEPIPRWRFDNPEDNGFFGGVAVMRHGAKEYVYAASYGFIGDLEAGNLVKVCADTGRLVWSTPCNRTSSIPVPLPDGRVIVAGGLHGFGTIPSVRCYKDHGQTVSLLWDTALQTWCDKNGNCIPDPEEFIDVGGWTTQPLVARSLTGDSRLYVGALPMGGLNLPYNTFVRININRMPWECDFVEDCTEAFGNTPAIANSVLYTTGLGGLAAY